VTYITISIKFKLSNNSLIAGIFFFEKGILRPASVLDEQKSRFGWSLGNIMRGSFLTVWLCEWTRWDTGVKRLRLLSLTEDGNGSAVAVTSDCYVNMAQWIPLSLIRPPWQWHWHSSLPARWLDIRYFPAADKHFKNVIRKSNNFPVRGLGWGATLFARSVGLRRAKCLTHELKVVESTALPPAMPFRVRDTLESSNRLHRSWWKTFCLYYF
jgi:hypothetical protein